MVLAVDLARRTSLLGTYRVDRRANESVLYTLSTDAGTFWIRARPADRVRLGIDNVELKTYSSPKAAARAVAGHNTGWDIWDRSAGDAFGLEEVEAWQRTPQRPQACAQKRSRAIGERC